jgi:hypothetical protein
MVRRARLIALAAVLVPGLVALNVRAQAPIQVRSQSIRGQVLDARNDVPLRRSRVVVSLGERRIESVFTDDDGRFVVANAPESPLAVRVTKAGYVPAIANVPSGAGADFRFALARSAAITGLVIDSRGAPVPDAFVAGRLLLPDANALLPTATEFFAQSDLFGEYRLGGLPAGRYEVRAVRVPVDIRFHPDKKVEDWLFGADSAGAGSRLSTMSLTAGEDVRDVDFTIAASAEECPQARACGRRRGLERQPSWAG